MTKEQVRFILGTPILGQGLSPDRWDYYFSLRDNEGNTRSYWLQIDFDQQLYQNHTVGKEIFALETTSES